MTQPPYVPPRDDEGSTANPTWPASQSTPTYDYGSTEPTYDESVSSVSVGDYSTDYSTGGQSTTDVAKDQAADVKNTAVEQGQQVAGVAKEQAGAVKDTAVEQGQHVAGVAKEQAGAVKDTAVGEVQHVAGVAKEQATKVATEASTQVKDLLSEGLSEVRQAATSQQKRLAGGVHSLATELGTMASKSDNAGPLTNYAQQASVKAGELSHWLENAEPTEVLDFLRSYARRRPGVFLGASALAGVLVGRLTRGFVGNAKDASAPALGSSYASTPSLPATDYSTSSYDTTSGYQSGTSTGSGVGTGYTADPTYSGEPSYLGTETGGTTDYPRDDTNLGYGGTGGGTR
jgi:hypothetical protein